MFRAFGTRKRFEAVFLIALILIMIAIATVQIWRLRVAAERAGVATMVGTLRSALGIRTAEVVLKQGIDAVATMDGMNPSELLQKEPSNYHTVKVLPPPEALAAYQWYFDESTRTLIYRVGNGESLETALPGPPRIRFRVTLEYDDRDLDGRFETGIDEIRGIALLPLEPYRWRMEADEK